ncbi:uncharacterized protein [Panulirus ornatus]|uniref:uncharacterized protein isoform X2 n=2 Tax=Panulirus ornatus TaxID=150431 RepID=UPI003A893DD3
MASRDVLSLSLDDIIKMKQRGRGSRGARGGRSRGRGVSSGRNSGFTRGGNSGGVRGRGRGVRVLSTKITGKSTLRGRSSSVKPSRGGRGRALTRGGRRGALVGSRGRFIIRGRGTNMRGGRGRGINNARGRGRGRGRGNSSQGGANNLNLNHQETYQQFKGQDSSFRQQLARRKVQQARRTLAMSQQNRRNQNRLNLIDARRGIEGGMKTRGNLGTPLKVRVGNGTIVRGLRSDQLLLQKMNSQSSFDNTRMDNIEALTENSAEALESSRGAGSVVSLSSQRGLTVSIKNNIASNQSKGVYDSAGTTRRKRPRLTRNRFNQISSTSYTPTTFTVVNDRVYRPPEPPFHVSSGLPRKTVKRNFISSRDPRARMAMAMSLGNIPSENMRSLPEPHKQILDPKVQKEIAMLQGKEEVSLNNGPGPGVKGFRHIPNQTTRSLNERFTEERMVTA